MDMTRGRIKELSKNPQEEELVLQGMQLAYDTAYEHVAAWRRVGKDDIAKALEVFASEIAHEMFRR